MIKLILFSTLIVSTLCAPAQNYDDHPAISTKPAQLDINEKKSSGEKSSHVIPAVERKYGEHVSKRDTNSDKHKIPKDSKTKPDILPATATLAKPKSTTEQKHKRETPPKPQNVPANPSDQKVQPAILLTYAKNQKSSAEQTKPQNIPANPSDQQVQHAILLPYPKNEKSSAEQTKHKRESSKPQTLPALPSDHKEQPQVLPAHSETLKSSSEHKHKRETPPKPQNIPAIPSDQKIQPAILPAFSRNQKTSVEQTKHKRETLQKPQTLPALPNDHKEQPQLKSSSENTHKRQNSKPQTLPATIIQKTKIDSTKTKVDDKNTNIHKRDIPVALTPSTSAKPETNEENTKIKTETILKDQHKNEHGNKNEPIPPVLSQYNHPVPVAELFKHNGTSA